MDTRKKSDDVKNTAAYEKTLYSQNGEHYYYDPPKEDLGNKVSWLGVAEETLVNAFDGTKRVVGDLTAEFSSSVKSFFRNPFGLMGTEEEELK